MPEPNSAPPSAPGPARVLIGAAGLGAALAWVGGPAAPRDARGGWGLFLGALALSLLAPALATHGDGPAPARAARGAAGAAAAALGVALGVLLLDAPAAALPGGVLYLILFGAALAALAAAAGGTPGQLLASGLGLGACSLPWWAGQALAGWSDLAQVRAVLWSPLPALTGSFAGLDPLRQGGLYHALPAAHSVSFAYLDPASALLGLLPLLAVAGLLLLVRAGATRGLRPPRGALAAAVLLALLARGEPARAQAIFEPTPAPDSQIGDLQTRVLLGYWLPDLRGKVKLDGKFDPGNDFSFTRHMDLDPILVLPTFEVDLNWDNGGRIGILYAESRWQGESQLPNTRRFKDVELPIGSFLETDYFYRAIALTGELHIPVYDFATLRIITTTRYIKHETRMRSVSNLNVISVHNSLEAVIPELGVGADISIWGPIHVYGDIQWLDFRTSIAGGQTGRFKFHHREYRLGVRLELVEHAHVLVEWYSLEHSVKDGNGPDSEYYEQRLNGIRVQVAVLF